MTVIGDIKVDPIHKLNTKLISSSVVPRININKGFWAFCHQGIIATFLDVGFDLDLDLSLESDFDREDEK